MRLEIARHDKYEGETKFIASGVLEIVCECESGFIERKRRIRKKANGANRSETLESRFRTPLLNLEFQEKCIEPILNSDTLS